MHRLATLLFLTAGANVAVAAARAGEPREPDGAQVYRDHCGRCHAPRQPSDLDTTAWPAAAFHMRTRAYLTRAETDALEEFLMPEPVQALASVGVLANAGLAANCVRCHTAERIEAAVAGGRTAPEWEATLTRMRSYGATITPEQARELAAWLDEQTPQR